MMASSARHPYREDYITAALAKNKKDRRFALTPCEFPPVN